MIPLQITAYLSNSFAVTDNFSPAIEGLVEYSIREELGLLDPNPIDLKDIKPVTLPLKLHPSGFYHCSSPHYIVEKESQTRYRKRWDYQERHLDWGSKKAKFSGSDGQYKAYDLPLFLRITPRIDWYVVGFKDELLLALNRITHLGKKRSQGQGLINSWHIRELPRDYSIFGENDELMRPIPVEIMVNQLNKPVTNTMLVCAWKVPSWHPENQALCCIPTNNVIHSKNAFKPILKNGSK